MLKKILFISVVVIVLFVAMAYANPQYREIERRIVIDAPPEVVFPHVAEFKKSHAWSPWANRDPNTKYEYTGVEGTVGANMSWVSEQRDVGTGSQTISALKAPEFVSTNLEFEGQGSAEAKFELKPTAAGTEVTWSLKADMGNSPIGRWMGLMMDKWIGEDYEKGLAKLKTVVEQQN